MQRPAFAQNKIYHIYNRGVEKRKIFIDKQDYLRFIHDLFEFNNENPTLNFSRSFNSEKPMNEIQPRSHLLLKAREKEPRKLLVKILIFVLMPNHFHLLLQQKKENGISRFMQKLGTGYTMYFNQKYERIGGLFQGRFKAVVLEEHAHFLHLPYYLHTNPLDLLLDRGSTSIREQLKFLEDYPWSSFSDYIGDKNFPSVTQREFLLEFFGGAEKYRNETKQWLEEKVKNQEKIKDIALE
jgi:putative transposase